MFDKNKISILFYGHEMLNNYNKEYQTNYEKSNSLKIERVSNGIMSHMVPTNEKLRHRKLRVNKQL